MHQYIIVTAKSGQKREEISQKNGNAKFEQNNITKHNASVATIKMHTKWFLKQLSEIIMVECISISWSWKNLVRKMKNNGHANFEQNNVTNTTLPWQQLNYIQNGFLNSVQIS